MIRMTNKIDRAISLMQHLGNRAERLKLVDDRLIIEDESVFKPEQLEKIRSLQAEFEFLITCRVYYHTHAGGTMPKNVFAPAQGRERKPTSSKVKCSNCAHFIPDQVGNSGGIGFCRAYLKSEWAYAEHNCVEYVER